MDFRSSVEVSLTSNSTGPGQVIQGAIIIQRVLVVKKSAYNDPLSAIVFRARYFQRLIAGINCGFGVNNQVIFAVPRDR